MALHDFLPQLHRWRKWSVVSRVIFVIKQTFLEWEGKWTGSVTPFGQPTLTKVVYHLHVHCSWSLTSKLVTSLPVMEKVASNLQHSQPHTFTHTHTHTRTHVRTHACTHAHTHTHTRTHTCMVDSNSDSIHHAGHSCWSQLGLYIIAWLNVITLNFFLPLCCDCPFYPHRYWSLQNPWLGLLWWWWRLLHYWSGIR